MLVTIDIPEKNLPALASKVADLNGVFVEEVGTQEYSVPDEVKSEVLQRMDDDPRNDILLANLKAEYRARGI